MAMVCGLVWTGSERVLCTELWVRLGMLLLPPGYLKNSGTYVTLGWWVCCWNCVACACAPAGRRCPADRAGAQEDSATAPETAAGFSGNTCWCPHTQRWEASWTDRNLGCCNVDTHTYSVLLSRWDRQRTRTVPTAQ